MNYITIRIDNRNWYYDRYNRVLRAVDNPNVELDLMEALLKLIEEHNQLLRLGYDLRRSYLFGGFPCAAAGFGA